MLRSRGRAAVERFAADIDEVAPGAHPSLEPVQDPLVALTQRLRTLDLDGAPDPEFRARARQRLIAVASVQASARAAATGHAGALTRAGLQFGGAEPDTAPIALPAPSPSTRRPGPAPALSRRLAAALTVRRLVVGVSAACTVLVVAAMLALFSRSALPGDPLYSLKRGTERAQLSLAGDDQDRGLTLLGFATTRLDEVRQLVGLPTASAAGGSVRGIAAGPVEAAGSKREAEIVATLEEMDRQTSEGTAVLTRFAVDKHDTAVLGRLSTWTAGQRADLASLTGRLPGTADVRAGESAGLLVRIDTRAGLLTQALPCNCGPAAGRSDDLGPLPPTGVTTPGPSTDPVALTPSTEQPTPDLPRSTATTESPASTTETPPYSPPTSDYTEPTTTDVPPVETTDAPPVDPPTDTTTTEPDPGVTTDPIDPGPTTDPAPTTDPVPTTDPEASTEPDPALTPGPPGVGSTVRFLSHR